MIEFKYHDHDFMSLPLAHAYAAMTGKNGLVKALAEYRKIVSYSFLTRNLNDHTLPRNVRFICDVCPEVVIRFTTDDAHYHIKKAFLEQANGTIRLEVFIIVGPTETWYADALGECICVKKDKDED